MIGIDISDRSVKLIQVSSGDSPRLQTACWSSLPPNIIRRGVIQDITGMIVALKDSLTRCSPIPIESGKAVLSIPETQSFVRVLELPTMTPTELEEAVQWAVRQHIPFDLERVYLDWQLLPTAAGRSGYQQILVGAAQRDVVDPLLEVMDGTDLQVVAFELEAQAIVRSLLPRESVDVAGVLLVDLGATSTNVIYFDRGAMRFTTSIQRGGDDLTQQLAQELKLQPSIAAEKKAMVGVQPGTSDAPIAATLRAGTLQLVQQINQVVREVMVSISTEASLRAVLLSGGAANLPGLVEVFAEVFPGIPVQMGNPWINLSVNEGKGAAPLSQADASHFTTAIGLALRAEELV